MSTNTNTPTKEKVKTNTNTINVALKIVTAQGDVIGYFSHNTLFHLKENKFIPFTINQTPITIPDEFLKGVWKAVKDIPNVPEYVDNFYLWLLDALFDEHSYKATETKDMRLYLAFDYLDSKGRISGEGRITHFITSKGFKKMGL